jgi:hypothetical protein
VLVTPQGSRRREGGDAVAEPSTSGRSDVCPAEKVSVMSLNAIWLPRAEAS